MFLVLELRSDANANLNLLHMIIRDIHTQCQIHTTHNRLRNGCTKMYAYKAAARFPKGGSRAAAFPVEGGRKGPIKPLVSKLTA